MGEGKLLQLVAPRIRGWGYQGSGQNYRRLVGDVIFVINFQKDRWDERFFVNLGGQPTTIQDENECQPNPRAIKEYDCAFRLRLPAECNITMSASRADALLEVIDASRRTFEDKVIQVRERSRQGRGRELLSGCDAADALTFARLLAADGHPAAARLLADFAIEHAGRADLFRAKAARLIASLPSPACPR